MFYTNMLLKEMIWSDVLVRFGYHRST